MSVPEIPGPVQGFGSPPLGFRFMVQLFSTDRRRVNVVDFMFQKVSGIGATVETTRMVSGGANEYNYQLPDSISYDDLVLTRGLMVASPLSLTVDAAINRFRFSTNEALVILLDNTKIPLASWLFYRAIPVAWKLSDLDATENAVVIETITLSYERMQVMKV